MKVSLHILLYIFKREIRGKSKSVFSVLYFQVPTLCPKKKKRNKNQRVILETLIVKVSKHRCQCGSK